jgi:AcrR family transcriptional regulator
VAEQLLDALRTAMTSTDRPRQMVAAAIDTYLAFIEADPELYRFVVHAPADHDPGADPIAGLSELVGEQATALVALALEQAGRPTAAAGPWGHGLVGLVRSAGDHWLGSADPMPRAELTAHLTDLAWAGLSGVVQPRSTTQTASPQTTTPQTTAPQTTPEGFR